METIEPNENINVIRINNKFIKSGANFLKTTIPKTTKNNPIWAREMMGNLEIFLGTKKSIVKVTRIKTWQCNFIANNHIFNYQI